ncbi:unnamed protein product [Plutella xylostella]|uniref:(diamondback moth) hypothetical protein n=1 Tax=Plutella xylostella TaxID=51655 RepID=A0A8S4G0T7_PLUXY|nr:unnamed protein product [Plutella xylostella]
MYFRIKQSLKHLRNRSAQGRIMMKLNDYKRFASFVEGDSHLSDDEIMDYESYAFSLENRNHRKPNHAVNSTTNHLEISDDDSSESEDEL